MSPPTSKKKGKRGGAPKRILAYLQSKFPEKVNTKEIEKVAGISDYQRRIRELRAEGWQIYSHHDDPNLKPDEYRLADRGKTKGYEFGPRIDGRTRARVLQRNGYTCRSCGRGVEDDDPVSPGRKIRLNVDHIDPNGPGTDDNLRVLCSACNLGKQDLVVPHGGMEVLRTVRRAPRDVQKAVYDWLKKIFEKQ